jgi:hypothetical protein
MEIEAGWADYLKHFREEQDRGNGPDRSGLADEEVLIARLREHLVPPHDQVRESRPPWIAEALSLLAVSALTMRAV